MHDKEAKGLRSWLSHAMNRLTGREESIRSGPLMVVLVVAAFITLTAQFLLASNARSALQFLPLTVSLVTLLVAYFLNRSLRYRLAASLLILVFPISVFGLALTGIDFLAAELHSYLLIGVMLCGLFLGRAEILSYNLMLVIATLLFRIVAGPAAGPLFEYVRIIAIQLLVALIMLAWVSLRNRQEAMRAAELKRSEARYRALYETTPAMMYSIDADLCIVYVSDRFLEVMGYTADEVLGHRSTEFITEKSRENAFSTNLPALMQTGQVRDIPYQFVTKNGRTIDILLSSIAEFDEQGRFVTSLAVLKDVTARNAAFADLREREDRLRFLNEFDRSLLQADSLTQLAAVVGEKLRRFVAFDFFAMTEIDEGQNVLTVLHLESTFTTSVNVELQLALPELPIFEHEDEHSHIAVIDLRAEPVLGPVAMILKDEGLDRLLFARFMENDQAYGGIAIAVNEAAKLGHIEVARVRELLAPLALSFIKVRLRERLQQQTSYLRALLDIETAIASSDDIHKLANNTIELIVANIPADYISIMRVDQPRGQVEVLTTRSTYEVSLRSHDREGYFPLERLIMHDEMQKGEMIILNSLEPYIDNKPALQLVHQDGVQHFVMLPLMYDGELIGVVDFGRLGPARFSAQNIRLAKSLAQPLALGFAQRQLTRQLRQQADRLGLLNEIALAVLSAQTVTEIAEFVTAKLDDFLAPSFIGVLYVDEEAGYIERIAYQSQVQATNLVNPNRFALQEFGVLDQARAGEQVIIDTAAIGAQLKHHSIFMRWQEASIREVLITPLVSKDGLQGNIIMGTRDPLGFSQHARKFVGDLGIQLAVAFAATRTNLMRRQQAQRLSIIHELEASILLTHELEAISEKAVHFFARLLDCELISIMGFDFRAGIAKRLGVWPEGRAHASQGERINLSQLKYLPRLQNSSYILIEKFSEQPDLTPRLEKFRHDGVENLLLLPLNSGERLIGVISLGRGAAAGFSQAEIELAQGLASPVAIAIAQADLVNDLRRQTKRLHAAHSIDVAILAAHSAKEIATLVIGHLKGLVTFDKADVLLWDDQTGRPQLLAESASRSFQNWREPIVDWERFQQESSFHQGRVWVENELTVATQMTPVQLTLIKAGLQSAIVVPLVTEGRLIGAVSLGAKAPFSFDEEDLLVSEGLADSLAIALRQAQLIEATLASEEQLRQLNAELESRVLQRTEELAAANEELSAFAYTVSHDLRAPLRHIDGFVRLLDKRLAGELDAKGQHYLEAISESTAEMSELIDGLLALARLGKVSLDQGRIAMRPLVEGVITEQSHGLTGRKIEWRLGDLTDAWGDAALVKLVWSNLIGNAIKYTTHKAAPVITIENHFDPEYGLDLVGYYVRDNGIGFDENYKDKLFGPFQRLHKSEEYPGTGIGLATVERIVTRHSGQVWAQSQLGEGATFFFTLPTAADGEAHDTIEKDFVG